MPNVAPFVALEIVEKLIPAVLRGGPTQWPLESDPGGTLRFVALARYHGVMPLLHECLSRMTGKEAWPQTILDACREEAIYQAKIELARRQEIRGVLDALAMAGIKPLVLKGGTLAYSHYPNPVLRPRADTDILIPRVLAKRSEGSLALLGYERSQGITGDLISYQASWSRSDHMGATHDLDVHWRINNSQILAQVLSYGELEPRSMPLPVMGPNAYALAPVDALLVACIHRTGHANVAYYVGDIPYVGGDRLIWLYDIHLLISAMSRTELHEFAALAGSKQIKAICLDAVMRCRRYFATPIPPDVLAALTPSGRMEPSARYFSGGRLRQMLGDCLALESWGDRARWVRELAHPSEVYMRSKYPDAANTWLPFLYGRRAWDWLRKLATGSGGHEH